MKITSQLDYAAIVRGRSERVHLALSFQAEKQTSNRSTPFAFALVLDNSGSMDGGPLEHAKSAAKMVITHLRPEDQVGLVVFSNSARTVIPLQPAGDKARLHSLVGDIQTEGMTNLTAGWMLGRDELAKAPADLPRKILLLTDGQLNMGIVEPAQVRQIAASGLEKERVRTSCLGFGDSYNEDLLNDLSKTGGGALHDADSPEKFPEIFGQELESLLKLSAQNVRVRLKKLHYCSGVKLISDYPTVDLPEGGVEIALGDLVSEEERVLVLALEVLPIPLLPDDSPAASLEGEALLEVEIVYDEILPDGVASKAERRTIRVLPVQSEADVQVNETVVAWVAEQIAGRAVAEAIADQDRGDTEAVAKRLSVVREQLDKYQRPDQTGAAAKTLREFEDSSRNWDARSRKTSRALSSRSMRTSSFYVVRGRATRALDRYYEELKTRGALPIDYAAACNVPDLPPVSMSEQEYLERFTGCVLGGAVGDALGRAREGRAPGGEWIAEYQPWPGWKSGPKGTITDDTQFSMWLLQALEYNKGVVPEHLVQVFTSERIRGIGRATLEFVTNVKDGGKQWWESGVPSAGNGVAMRSAPLGLFYCDDASGLKLATILQAVVTHNDRMAVASGILVAGAISLLLRIGEDGLRSLEGRQNFCRCLADMIQGLEAGGDYRTRNTNEPATLEQRFRQDLPQWLEKNLEPLEVNNRCWSGAYALESVPHAFYCFLRTPGDFRETLLQAVNTSRDADTVAAIACNLSGAFNGRGAIPQPYLDELEFRQELESLAEAIVPL